MKPKAVLNVGLKIVMCLFILAVIYSEVVSHRDLHKSVDKSEGQITRLEERVNYLYNDLYAKKVIVTE